MQPVVQLTQSYGAADLEQIQALRYEVLRKPLGLPVSTALFEGDNVASTVHLLAFGCEGLVGCATLLTDLLKPQIQLRGMAVRPELQGKGIGKQIVDLSKRLAKEKVCSLWCNARESAVDFYTKQGWTIQSDFFDVPVIGKHVVMSWMLPK